ncbi:hypothetical protein M569_06609 [Genlisea aurea]|uniref:Nuclear speckle splicing regulatory protein 1 N-terminal domain-containing protein n=1 Tax=Genlisea aurea TaxID=192259 RepID=S8CLZ8_9LAMI|nr:hypothetical protein M569_06609 [Genlisea aurea]
MKKYGLQIRAPPQQKKQASTPPISNPFFADDDDDDNVEREIMRQAYKNKNQKDIEEQQKKALEEDPSVFDYDGVYDKMKEKQIRPIQQDRQERKPKYIQALIDKAKQREREHEIIYERKLAKERDQDEHLYADKDKFVTSAYKKKLAEQEKWLAEERLREMREEKEDVTKKTDLSDFYFNLSKNVAYGAETESRKSDTPPAARPPQQEGGVSLPVSGNEKESRAVSGSDIITSTTDGDRGEDEQPSSASHDKQSDDAAPSLPDDAPKDHFRRSEDAVAAARERFLARKKAKIQ